MNILTQIDKYLDVFLSSMGVYGPIIGSFLICIESILPILPLSVFITLNFLAFGKLLGFLISWIFTILGCMLSFTLVRKNFKKAFDKQRKNKERINKIMKTIENINFSSLVVIISIPFTPAFLVNIAAGLTKISYKRFLFALIIGKISLVYFWGYIGMSLLESIKNPYVLLKVLIMLFIAYIISYFVNKKFKLD